jgi:hypothetical protein
MLPYPVIVFIDIPDPDNLLMVLDVIINHPNDTIAIVLSPRVVDLSVPRYGQEFETIKDAVGLANMAIPIESDDALAVPDHLQDWFYKDANTSDLEVMQDTLMYMRTSSLRIAEILQKYGVLRERYRIFWDEGRLQTAQRPDMRHAFHVHDFSYSFNNEEMKSYKQAIAHSRTRSLRLRVSLRRVIHTYMTRQVGELALTCTDDKLNKFEELVKANKDLKNARLIIGGPFTEALAYLKGTRTPDRIVAMAFSIRMDRNIFQNLQFNLWKDMQSAEEFVGFVQKRKIKLDIVPTEVCKGTENNACPFELRLKDYYSILGEHSLLYHALKQYKLDTDRGETYAAFDWIAAIAATKPSIFQWRSIKLRPKSYRGVRNIFVEEVDGDEESTICMAWDDYDFMKEKRMALKSRMCKTARCQVE